MSETVKAEKRALFFSPPFFFCPTPFPSVSFNSNHTKTKTKKNKNIVYAFKHLSLSPLTSKKQERSDATYFPGGLSFLRGAFSSLSGVPSTITPGLAELLRNPLGKLEKITSKPVSQGGRERERESAHLLLPSSLIAHKRCHSQGHPGVASTSRGWVGWDRTGQDRAGQGGDMPEERPGDK